MKLIAFTKMFKELDADGLIAFAKETGLDGFDLCVRPDYIVNPDNAAEALPAFVQKCRDNGLCVAQVTGNFDLLSPDHPTTEPILSAMDKAGVRHIKLGYFNFKPEEMDYWAEVERVRGIFSEWEKVSRKHNVKICYHTHSNRCMGINCAMLAHLLRGTDPECIGAYIDPGHMCVEGEEFPVGVAIVRDYLSLVAVKDVLIKREEKNGHGSKKAEWVGAGKGNVDWTQVFGELVRVGYDGPVSVHCEFHAEGDEFMKIARDEIAFFRAQLDRVLA